MSTPWCCPVQVPRFLWTAVMLLKRTLLSLGKVWMEVHGNWCFLGIQKSFIWIMALTMFSLNSECILKPQNVSFSSGFHDSLIEEVDCERHMTMRLYLAGLTSKEVNFWHTKIFKSTDSVQSHLDLFFFLCRAYSELFLWVKQRSKSHDGGMTWTWHCCYIPEFNSHGKAVSSSAKKGPENSFISGGIVSNLMLGQANSNHMCMSLYIYICTYIYA